MFQMTKDEERRLRKAERELERVLERDPLGVARAVKKLHPEVDISHIEKRHGAVE